MPLPRVLSITLALVTVGLMTSCTVTSAGSARPASSLTEFLTTGEHLEKILPDEAQLSSILQNRITEDPRYPLTLGGIEEMTNGWFSNPRNTPRDCLGVVFNSAQRNIYRGTNLQGFASNNWKTLRPAISGAISLGARVTAMRTIAAADNLFTHFVDQWEGCRGATVTIFKPDTDTLKYRMTIDNVDFSGTTLSANVQSIPMEAGMVPIFYARALGVRGNCLVDVNVLFATDPNDSAIRIANLMMDKVGNLE